MSSLDRIWARPGIEHFKLDWNEASVPPSPRVYAAIVSFLSNSNHLNWYPELGSHSLAHSLADYTGVPAGQILVTNGSDDALELVCKAFIDAEDTVLVPQPTYTHFLVYVQSRGATVVDFFADDIFDADIDRLEAVVRTGGFKLVYLVSPNNPTGVVYTRAQVERLLIAAPATLFIVDEAYHEFYGETVV
ncbi:MAG TPA: aminotransferase class I/II-fold pyridoxal phosphate-dependent enzyme, partial [Nannocystis sp.]